MTSRASASPFAAGRPFVRLVGVCPVELLRDGPGALLGGKDETGAVGDEGPSVSISWGGQVVVEEEK
jgi:hypothetical protein